VNEASYYHHRGFSSDHIRRVRAHYLRYFHDAERVLELGCGRGEFLDLLREQGKEVVGVELAPEMAEAASAKNLRVIQGKAQEVLAQEPAESYDAVVAAHLLEHLPVEEAHGLLEQAAAVLTPGGIVCLVVPNVSSLPVLAEEFWNDPSHVRPYGHELLAYLVTRHGLKVIDRGINPLDQGGYPIDLGSIETGSTPSPLHRMAIPELGHLRHLLQVFEGNHARAEVAELPVELKDLWQAMVYVARGLTEELKDAHQRIYVLNEQTLFLNHQLIAMGRNLAKLVTILYNSNEYFVIAQKGLD